MDLAKTKRAGGPRFSPRATLVAVGELLRTKQFFDPIHQHVVIPQKEVEHAPTDKLLDVLITILSGAHGIVEANTRLRSDELLQHAFGRTGCAEQSTIQRTLDACTDDNVTQMRFAFELILQRHSRAFRHPYLRELLVLDVDLSSLLCGATAEMAAKGHFSNVPKSKLRHARGRQLGRVTAADYNEIVVDRLYRGNINLETVLRDLLLATEQALVLAPDKRMRTLLRIDSGGGALETVNWMLGRGYHVLCKDVSSVRAKRLAESVVEWYSDPRQPHRELGWVTEPAEHYERPVRRLAMRTKNKKGEWRYGVMITSLEPHQARAIAGELPSGISQSRSEMLAIAYAYDLRAGAIELEYKQDKSGLGIQKRQKKRAAAAQMVVLLNALAHNVLMWARRWLAATAPELGRIGLLRMVRDVLRIAGEVELSEDGQVRHVRLNARAPRARQLAEAFEVIFKQAGIATSVSAA